MAVRGDVIDNPVTGERITFLQTSRETNGAGPDRLLFKFIPFLAILGRGLGYKPTYPEYSKDA